MNPLATGLRDRQCDDVEFASPNTTKSEIIRPTCPQVTLWYLNLFGSYLSPDRSFGPRGTVWYYFMSVCFSGYFCFFLLFGAFDFIYFYYDYFWVLYLTMLIKCVILRRSVFEIRSRLVSEQFRDIIEETAGVVEQAKKYFVFAVAANTAVIVLYDTVVLVGHFYVPNLLVSVVFLLGTVVFTGYMSTIILFCLADARYARKEVNQCIALAREGKLTPAQYSESQRKIDFIVKNSFWIDGAMLIFICINTISAIVLLLTYDRFTEGYTVLEIVSFIVYVLVVMWAVDAAFALFIVPEIAEVNEAFTELHVLLAESKFAEADAEISRYDTLHLAVARPVRYLIAGFYLTRKNVKSRILGIFLTMFFFIARLIVLLVLQHHDS